MEKITNITAWITDINPGDVKCGYLPCEKAHTLYCLASRYNCGRGRTKNVFAHVHYCSNYEMAVAVCETLEDYFNNKNEGNENEWKSKIPKDYR